MLLAHPGIHSHNVKDANGKTPLMWAIGLSNMNCIKELLKDETVDLDTGSENLSQEVRREERGRKRRKGKRRQRLG